MRVIGDMDVARTIRDLAVPVGRELVSTLRRDHPAVLERLPN
jgi:hypothetical protein